MVSLWPYFWNVLPGGKCGGHFCIHIYIGIDLFPYMRWVNAILGTHGSGKCNCCSTVGYVSRRGSPGPEICPSLFSRIVCKCSCKCIFPSLIISGIKAINQVF